MLNERLQILVTAEQRRRLEEEAKRRGTSVGSLIREAVDARFGSVTAAERLEALEGIRATSGSFIPAKELNRLVEDERDSAADQMLEPRRR
jgi:ribosome maturation protein Sdo1